MPSGVGRAVGFADGRGRGVSARIRQAQPDARLRAWRCVDIVRGGQGGRVEPAVRGCRVDLQGGKVGLILCDAGWMCPCLPGSGVAVRGYCAWREGQAGAQGDTGST